jgi:hypothetical protein
MNAYTDVNETQVFGIRQLSIRRLTVIPLQNMLSDGASRNRLTNSLLAKELQ